MMVRVMLWPPSELKGILNSALPCREDDRVLIGVMVKEQVLAVRETEDSLVVSMAVAFAQAMVWPLDATSST